MSTDPRVRLVSDRLILREFALTDEQMVHAYAADRLVTQFLEWGPNTIDDTRRFLHGAVAEAASPARSKFSLAVVHRASRAVIGSVVIVTDVRHQQGALGYVLHQNFWRQGYATEAARLMVRFGFDRLRLQRISATCHPDNHASARVLQKAGLKYETHIRRHLFVHGAWRDSLLYGADSNPAGSMTASPPLAPRQHQVRPLGASKVAGASAIEASSVQSG